EAVENIDIGGPAMLRAAAKNHAHVGVLVDPADYGPAVAEIDSSGGLSFATRRRLPAGAYAHTAAYDALVAEYLGGVRRHSDPHSKGADEQPAAAAQGDRAASDPSYPQTLLLHYTKKLDLRYGENPHQSAAFYADPVATGASIAT